MVPYSIVVFAKIIGVFAFCFICFALIVLAVNSRYYVEDDSETNYDDNFKNRLDDKTEKILDDYMHTPHW